MGRVTVKWRGCEDKRAARGRKLKVEETKKVKKDFHLLTEGAKKHFSHCKIKDSALRAKLITPNPPWDLGRKSRLPDQKKDQMALFIRFSAHEGILKTWQDAKSGTGPKC